MNETFVMAITKNMLTTAVLIAGPVLLGGLVVGLLAGILQAATQIQESALNFIPKLVVILVLLMAGGPWAVERLVIFAHQSLESLATLSPSHGVDG